MIKIRQNGVVSEIYGDASSKVFDKNGKEIFENDNVKIYHKGQHVVCKVFFKDGLFGLQWPDGYMNMFPIQSNCEVI